MISSIIGGCVNGNVTAALVLLNTTVYFMALKMMKSGLPMKESVKDNHENTVRRVLP